MRIKSITKTTLSTSVPVYDVINSLPYHNFFIKTNSSKIVSHNCALMDEVSFAPGQNVSYEKSKIFDTYTNIRRRMESRFMVQGKNYGLMILVSSKATESSFLEAYIADQIKKGYPIYVVDQPLWKVKPAAYSGKMFKVAVGNKYVPSRVSPEHFSELQLTQWIEDAQKSGLNVIDVPVEHRQAFDQDLDKALQDIAGISTATVSKAFSAERLLKCVSETLTNPFTTEVVTIGMKDDLQLRDFFHPELIPDEVKGAPLFIHLDASVRGDRTGLSGVAVVGTTEVITYGADVDDITTSTELVYQQVFTVGIQAPSDAEISFEKTRQFIYYLRDEVGLNIKLVSTDGFQSVDVRQILTTKGFNTAYTSLDRTPDGYDSLRSAINDKRIILLQGTKELQEEITELERDNLTFKYDHPVGGKKDEADSLAGAFLDASKYKSEFMFFKSSDFDYEGLNKTTDYAAEVKQDMIESMLGEKLSSDTLNKLFDRSGQLNPSGPSISDGNMLLW